MLHQMHAHHDLQRYSLVLHLHKINLTWLSCLIHLTYLKASGQSLT
jgi:hypothetical protein